MIMHLPHYHAHHDISRTFVSPSTSSSTPLGSFFFKISMWVVSTLILCDLSKLKLMFKSFEKQLWVAANSLLHKFWQIECISTTPWSSFESQRNDFEGYELQDYAQKTRSEKSYPQSYQTYQLDIQNPRYDHFFVRGSLEHWVNQSLGPWSLGAWFLVLGS